MQQIEPRPSSPGIEAAAELASGDAAGSDIVVASRAASIAEDGWVQLLPSGRWMGRDGRGPYLLEDAQGVIDRTLASKKDLPVDRDHAMDLAPKGSPAPAMGWITELAARDDGIWGRVDWTPTGKQLVEGREYRWLSPVFRKRPNGAIDVILRAGLTNDPNFPLRELASQESGMPLDVELRRVLALAESEGAAAIVAAVERAVERADRPDPARFVPVAQFQEVASQLAGLQAQVAKEVAERDVGGAITAGKLAPAQRQWAMDYAAADPDGFRAFVASAPVIVQPGVMPAKAPAPSGAAALSVAELEVCARLDLKPEVYLAQRREEAR